MVISITIDIKSLGEALETMTIKKGIVIVDQGYDVKKISYKEVLGVSIIWLI